MPRQFLVSTRAEIALACGSRAEGAVDEAALDEAESWFTRALAEAERKNGNQIQAANIRANLSLVARRRGDLDVALKLLMNAYNAIMKLAATHLQPKIDLWLAELY